MKTRRTSAIGTWWFPQASFWQEQAALCATRRDFYRMLAHACEPPSMRHHPFAVLAAYCRMQASSCQLQGDVCRIFATLSI